MPRSRSKSGTSRRSDLCGSRSSISQPASVFKFSPRKCGYLFLSAGLRGEVWIYICFWVTTCFVCLGDEIHESCPLMSFIFRYLFASM